VFSDWPQLLLAYDMVWAVLCLFVPLFILIVCNVCLLRALRQSRQLQRLCRANHPSSTAAAAAADGCRAETATGGGAQQHQQRITPTLIALIVVFITCVSPSALLFVIGVGDPATSGSTAAYHVYQTATVVANWLFLVNFAVNFVLYCVVNVRFRSTARDLFCCAASTDRRSASRQLLSVAETHHPTLMADTVGRHCRTTGSGHLGGRF